MQLYAPPIAAPVYTSLTNEHLKCDSTAHRAINELSQPFPLKHIEHLSLPAVTRKLQLPEAHTAMASRRRLGKDDLVTIRLSEEACSSPVVADKAAVAAFSSIYRHLPPSATVWDLSGLLVEGQPVRRETVVAWLNEAYLPVHGELFEQQHQQGGYQQGGGGDSNHISSAAVTSSMAGLAQLLGFTEAVGSSKGMMLALDAQLDTAAVTASVKVGGQSVVQLSLGSCYSSNAQHDGTLTVYEHSPWQPAPKVPSRVAATVKLSAEEVGDEDNADNAAAATAEELQEEFSDKLAAQLEPLLYYSYKLKMPRLRAAMHACVRNWTADYTSPDIPHSSALLDDGALQGVFSSRFWLTAAADKASRTAMIDSLIAEKCSLQGGGASAGSVPPQLCAGMRQLLRPVGVSAEQFQQPLSFDAEVMQDYAHYRRGQHLHVKLGLFTDGSMHLEPCDACEGDSSNSNGGTSVSARGARGRVAGGVSAAEHKAAVPVQLLLGHPDYWV